MTNSKKFSIVISMLIIMNSCFGCYKINSSSIDKYLEKNSNIIKLGNNFSEKNFELLNECIGKNDIFLAGESHAIKTNYDLKLSLLIYYNRAAGVNYLLVELGYGTSGLINRYLETGNEEILDYIYKNIKGAYECNIESYDFWKKLRTYNLTLPPEKRIKAIGIDMERPMDISLKYLQSLIPDYNAPTIITERDQSLKTSLNNVQNLEIDDVKKILESLRADIENNKNTYIQYLGINYFDFTYIIDNILNTIHGVADESKEFEIREQYMFENFVKIYNHFPKGKYFGQFGLEHVLQGEYESYIGKFERFAKRLSNSNGSPVKDKVTSIAYEYKDCYRMEGNRELPAECNFYDTDILDKYAKEELSIFKLDGKHSPFKNRLVFIKGTDTGTTTDYFQYIILIKNSRGATPFTS